LVKDLKDLRDYAFHSKILDCVPTIVIKDILIYPDSEGRRGKWIAKIQEYDVDIKPKKLVKGEGLAKLLIESNCKSLGMNVFSSDLLSAKLEVVETQEPPLKVNSKFSQFDWYKDIIFYLQNLMFQLACTWPKIDLSNLRISNIASWEKTCFGKNHELYFSIVSLRKKLKESSLNFTREYVVATMLGEPLSIRSSKLVIIGPLFSMM